MNANHIRQTMRFHKVTIHELAARMDITIKRVRHVRKHGIPEPHIVRDWLQAITGRDPGPQRPDRRLARRQITPK